MPQSEAKPPKRRIARIRWRQHAAGAFLFLLSMLLCGAIVEVLARVFVPTNPVSSVMHIPHPERLVTYAPNASDVFPLYVGDGRHENIPWQTSSLGLRDREYGSKQPDEYRVLLLGDSFVNGWGLLEDDMISRCLERVLPTLPNGKRLTAISLGVTGYAPWQERLLLNDIGFGLEPDVVILQLFPSNDVEGSLEETGEHLRAYHPQWKRILRRWQHAQSWPTRVDRWLLTRSRAYAVVVNATGEQYTLGGLLRRIPLLPGDTIPELPPSEARAYAIEPHLRNEYVELAEGWKRLEYAVGGIADDCAKRQVEFAVFAIPERESVVDEEWQAATATGGDPTIYDRGKAIRRIEEMCLAKSWAYLNVAAAIESLDDPAQAYLEYDRHFSRVGTNISADVIAQYLGGHGESKSAEALDAPGQDDGN